MGDVGVPRLSAERLAEIERLERFLPEVRQTLQEMERGEFPTVERCALEARYLLAVLVEQEKEQPPRMRRLEAGERSDDDVEPEKAQGQ